MALSKIPPSYLNLNPYKKLQLKEIKKMNDGDRYKFVKINGTNDLEKARIEVGVHTIIIYTQKHRI